MWTTQQVFLAGFASTSFTCPCEWVSGFSLTSFPWQVSVGTWSPLSVWTQPANILLAGNFDKFSFLADTVHSTNARRKPLEKCSRASHPLLLLHWSAILARAHSSFTYFVVYALQLQPYYFQAGHGRKTGNIWPLLATTTLFLSFFFTSTSFVILISVSFVFIASALWLRIRAMVTAFADYEVKVKVNVHCIWLTA